LKEYIEERAVAIANYIIDHNATVRQTAKKFGISKSTVHKDVTKWTADGFPSSKGGNPSAVLFPERGFPGRG